MTALHKIHPYKLSNLISKAKAPVIIDVRIDDDFDDDPRILPAARRIAFEDSKKMLDKFTDKSIVIYCQKGLKLSQGVAAILQNHGCDVAFLEGGQFAWRDLGLPMVDFRELPINLQEESSLWVTSDKPTADRLACAWLINRFINHEARTLFVDETQVFNVADRFSATAFAYGQGKWGTTKNGNAFHNFVATLGLNCNGLERLNKRIETKQNDVSTILEGISVLKSPSNDQSQIYFMVFDALYARLKRKEVA